MTGTADRREAARIAKITWSDYQRLFMQLEAREGMRNNNNNPTIGLTSSLLGPIDFGGDKSIEAAKLVILEADRMERLAKERPELFIKQSKKAQHLYHLISKRQNWNTGSFKTIFIR